MVIITFPVALLVITTVMAKFIWKSNEFEIQIQFFDSIEKSNHSKLIE